MSGAFGDFSDCLFLFYFEDLFVLRTIDALLRLIFLVLIATALECTRYLLCKPTYYMYCRQLFKVEVLRRLFQL